MRNFKKLLLVFILLFTFTSEISFANNISENSYKVYDILYKSLNKTARTSSQTLDSLWGILDNISDSKWINANNSKLIGELQKINNEKIFELEFKNLEQKSKNVISSIKDLSFYTDFLYNEEWLIKENWVWYWIYNTHYQKFQSIDKVNYNNLKANNLLNKNYLITYSQKENNIFIINDYILVKLVRDELIYWFPDKLELLKSLKINKQVYLSIDKTWSNINDDDNIIQHIKNTAEELTKNIYNKEEKIEKIYAYVVDSISYDHDAIEVLNPKAQSWIDTYVRKTWVCEWFVELFQLLLWFNNIESTWIIWYSFTDPNYPEIMHMWLRIWDYYYDPTFDDAVVWTNKASKSIYEFYKLPKDIIYADRYDLKDEQKYKDLETKSLEDRENIKNNNLNSLYQKYKNSWYNIFNLMQKKDELWLSTSKNISLNDLQKILITYKFKSQNENQVIVTLADWKQKYLKYYEYYTIDNNTIEYILYSTDINLDDYVIIEYTDNIWKTEHYLSQKSMIQFWD